MNVSGECQFSDNTPPIMWLDRNWRIPNTEPVNTVVTRVHAEDNEHDALVFGLEPLPYGLNAPAPKAGQQPATHLPFRIDNTTGVVYLNESLKNMVSIRSLAFILWDIILYYYIITKVFIIFIICV